MISVRKSDACMGAEISGVDLSRPLPDPAFGEVRAFDAAEVPVPGEVRRGRRGGVGQRIGAALGDPHRS